MMSSLEKAFNTLVILLCQEVSKKEEQFIKLQRDLDERPTHEMLAELRKERDEAIQDSLRAQDEVHVLRRAMGNVMGNVTIKGPVLKPGTSRMDRVADLLCDALETKRKKRTKKKS